MNNQALQNLVCAIFDLAYKDLKSGGKNGQSAESFFNTGAYIFYTDLAGLDSNMFYKAYLENRCDCRQLELF